MKKRINISINSLLLKQIDRFRAELGESRSMFLARAAQAKLSTEASP